MQTSQEKEEKGEVGTAPEEEINQEHPKCYISTGNKLPPAKSCQPKTGVMEVCDGCDMQFKGDEV